MSVVGGKADVKRGKADIAGKALKIDNLGATVLLRGQPLLRCPHVHRLADHRLMQ